MKLGVRSAARFPDSLRYVFLKPRSRVTLGQSSPLTSMLGQIEDRVQQNQIIVTHIATLYRGTGIHSRSVARFVCGAIELM
jgi:hypothetical protein